MAALILLALTALALLALAGYLVKSIGLFFALATIAILIFIGYTSVFIAGVAALILHQLGGSEFLPYTLVLALVVGLGAALFLIRRIVHEVVSAICKLKRRFAGNTNTPLRKS